MNPIADPPADSPDEQAPAGAAGPGVAPKTAASTTAQEKARLAAERAAEAAAERTALAWAHTARFLTTASRLDQLPPPGLPEVAFVGRSNAGKSTAINTLAQVRRLAFASKTPGRTQHINLFEVGPADAANARWADLPGYGYAAVARDAKLRWQQVMADYLSHRPALAGIVMMVDSRHGFTALDRQLLDFVAPRVSSGEVKLLVLLTKADKLNRAEATKSLAQAQAVLGAVASDQADISVALFSALSRLGIGDAALALHQWLLAGEAGDGGLDGPSAPLSPA